DTEFNESFAVAVERIGAERWLTLHASEAARAEAMRIEARRDDFRALTSRYRAALESLYRSDQPAAAKRARKADLFAAMRAEHEAQKRDRWSGFAGFDSLFARANNALN